MATHSSTVASGATVPRLDQLRWNHGLMTIPRSRGATSGLIILLLGLWVGLIPFIGPYFGFGFGSDATWNYTMSRLWFSILPGAAAFLGGAILMASANRAVLSAAAWLAMLGGIWLIVGVVLSGLWNAASPGIGVPLGGHIQQVFERISFFYGSGAIITALAGMALGRLSLRSVRDIRAAAEAEEG
ncbi:MAG TPA: hypothetical protein VFL85_00140 [Candidatus Saccharimonadales bacterium]|nr:hypothetical protein [Candidatus Saccharimonadales bacterium]